MFQTNNRYTGCLFDLITIIVIIFSSCISDNDEIIVNHDTIDNTIEWVVQYPPDKTDVINFGFELRMNQKKKYMHVLTGRDSKEITNGFTDSHDEGLARLRELATRIDIIK